MTEADEPNSPVNLLDRNRAELLRRITADFEVAREVVSVAEMKLDFLRVADPDKVLDDICAQEERARRGIKPKRQLRMPYWAAVWESAASVGQWLGERPELVAGRSTMDLGCGMGLAGMAMASLGGRVLLGDIETAALLFAQFNTLAWPDRCRVRRIDWQTDRLNEKFDLIVGSDVLYERAQWEFIEPFLKHHLAETGTAVIGEPGRLRAEEFPRWIADRGWTIEASRVGKINVYELSAR